MVYPAQHQNSLLQSSRPEFFSQLPSSTLSLTSINTASSPLAEALDFRFVQDLGEEGNLGALLAGFTGPGWEKEKDVLFSKFRSRGFHTMLINQSHPAGSSSSDSEPQIDCGMGVKMVNQALATSQLFSSHRRSLLSVILLSPSGPSSLPKIDQALATARLFSSHRRPLLSLILLPPSGPSSLPKIDQALSSLLTASAGLKDTMTIVTARSSSSPLLPLPFFLLVPRQV